MEDLGLFYGIILNSPQLRDGLLRSIESSATTSASSQRLPVIDGLVQLVSRTIVRFTTTTAVACPTPEAADARANQAQIIWETTHLYSGR